MFHRSRRFEKRRTKNRETLLPCFVASYTSIIRPYAFTAYLMGFLPYKIESSNFVFSKLSFVFCTVINVVYLICSVGSIYQLNFANSAFDTLSTIIHCNICVILGPMIFVSAYAVSRSAIRAIQSISKVSRILPQQILRKLAIRIFIKDTMMILPLFSYVPELFANSIVFFNCTCFYTFFGVIVMNNLFSNNIYMLSICFKHINDALGKIKQTLINDEPHLLRRVYHTQKNPMLLTKLKTLKKHHLEISKAVQLLNHSFSMQNLIIITLIFIDITFNLYAYLTINIVESTTEEWPFFVVVFVIYYSIHVIITVWTAETVRSQVEKIGLSIHRILVHTFDEQLTTELELFSLQVLQMDITFKAKGLTIDATLLTKILCSVTTFLLILIQFLLVKFC